MTPAIITQGQTEALRINHALLDPTGYTFRAALALHPGAPPLYSWPPGGITSYPGFVLFHMDPAVTSTWTWRQAIFGVELITPGGQVQRLHQETITLDREVVL